MAADPRIVSALLRFHTEAQIEAFYQAALTAYKSRTTVGQIIAQSMDGASSSAAVPDDPREAMEACEAALASLEDTATDAESVCWDFRNRQTGT